MIVNAWGVGICALILLALIGVRGQDPVRLTSSRYWLALACLAVIGSMIGFTTYLLLVARIGSARASYANAVFPVVALLIPTLFERIVWTPGAIAGLALALIGNVLMFAPATPLPRLRASARCQP